MSGKLIPRSIAHLLEASSGGDWLQFSSFLPNGISLCTAYYELMIPIVQFLVHYKSIFLLVACAILDGLQLSNQKHALGDFSGIQRL